MTRPLPCAEPTARALALVTAVAALALLTPQSARAEAARPAGVRPEITSISASCAPAGSTLTIQGRHFGQPRTTSMVTFAGVKAAYRTWTDTLIEAVVPARAPAGYLGVTVQNLTSRGVWFVPSARPSVLALSSAVAPVGSSVTLFGSGFGRTQRRGWVSFGGVRAPIRSWGDRRVVATVPEGAKTGFVGVWQNDLPSNGVFFTAFLPPAIGGVSVQYGMPGETLTVFGQRFGTAADEVSVTLAGARVEPDEWGSDRLRFTIPDDASSGLVGVWRNGVASNGAYVLVVPRLKRLQSWHGEPGAELTLLGSSFGEDPGRVTFAGKTAQIVSWSKNKVVARIPADAREGYVGVWRGWTCSNGIWFLPIEPAHIDTITPSAARPGDTVTIKGRGFGPSGSGTARLGSAQLETLWWEDRQVIVRIPEQGGSGYLGIWKRDVASNGELLTLLPPRRFPWEP